jgi:hypothetical protein
VCTYAFLLHQESFSMILVTNLSYQMGCHRGNGWSYTNPNDNYQATYSTVAYTDPIPLLGSPVRFLPNHAYHNVMWYNAYSQPKNDGFGYKTPPQFHFRLQPIDMMLARNTTEPCVDPNNLTNQLSSILWESFGIEPKGRGVFINNHNPITTTNSITLEVIEFLSFLSLVWRMVKPH